MLSAFRRVTVDSFSGGAAAGASYDNSVTWFGPVSVNESDGSVTKFTYTTMGQVASKIIYSGTNHAVKFSWVYDAAGNAVSVTTASVDSSGNVQSSPLPVTNTYSYDSLGRLRAEVDNSGGSDVTANRTTTYLYTGALTANRVLTITNPDGSGEVLTKYLDGSLDTDLGSAVTSSSGNEGVIDPNNLGPDGHLIDARGGYDPQVLPNSTWTSLTTGGAANTTYTYRNPLGQVYLVQKTAPNSASHTVQPVADARMVKKLGRRKRWEDKSRTAIAGVG